jgi:hypothetical protein
MREELLQSLAEITLTILAASVPTLVAIALILADKLAI